MNPYAFAATILGAWLLLSVPTAFLLGAVITRRDRTARRDQ